MPATPARIGFIQNEFRLVNARDTVVQTRYGTLARDIDSKDPIETFFDNEADAQAVADAQLALLGVKRRRFSVQFSDGEAVANLTYAGALPVAAFTDTEKAASANCAIGSISFDLATGAVTSTLWG